MGHGLGSKELNIPFGRNIFFLGVRCEPNSKVWHTNEVCLYPRHTLGIKNSVLGPKGAIAKAHDP